MEAKRAGLTVGMAVIFVMDLSSIGKPEEPTLEPTLSKPADVPENWKRVDVAGKFHLRLPPEMVEQKEQEKDSLVRNYRSEKITLSCDYGKFSGSLTNDGQPNFEKKSVTVGGKSADLVTYETPNGKLPLVAAIHFPDPAGDKRLRLTAFAECKDAKSQEVAVQILKSITFP